MKHYLMLLLLLGNFVAQINAKEEPEDKTIIVEREVLPFEKLHISGSVSIVIQQGDKELVVLEGKREVLDNVITKVSDGILRIEYDPSETGGWWEYIQSFWSQYKLKHYTIHLTAKNLHELSIRGVAKIFSENELKGENLKVHVAGAGKVDLNVKYKEVDASISGLGDIFLAGSAEDLGLKITGAGSFHGRDFKTKKAQVIVSGSGNAYLNVSDTLDVQVAGAGDVSYIGNPKITQNIAGAGSVRPLNEK